MNWAAEVRSTNPGTPGSGSVGNSIRGNSRFFSVFLRAHSSSRISFFASSSIWRTVLQIKASRSGGCARPLSSFGYGSALSGARG